MTARLVRLAIVGLTALVLAGAAYLAFVVLRSPAVRNVNGWELGGQLPNARGETASAVAGGRFWLIGGMTGPTASTTDEVTMYALERGEWSEAPPLPAPRHHASAAAGPDDVVYVSGGQSSDGLPHADVWSIRAGDAAWTTLPDMPETRGAHRMVSLDGRLYVIGGIGGTARVLIYDPESHRWSARAEMPGARNHLAAVAVNDEIWAIGGRLNGQGRAQARVDIYDPTRDAWRSGPALPAPTSAAAEGVLNGVILVSGGEDPQISEDVIDRHWRLDPGMTPLRWQPLDGPPLTVHGTAGGVIDGAFVIAGGAWRPGASSRFAWSNLTQIYRPPQ